MPRFKHYNYDQDAMVVINYQESRRSGCRPETGIFGQLATEIKIIGIRR